MDIIGKKIKENHIFIDAAVPSVRSETIKSIRFIDADGKVIAERKDNFFKISGCRLAVRFKIDVKEEK